MNVRIAYREPTDLTIQSLAVIGDFNHFDPKKGKMEKSGQVWTFSQHLPPGEYAYRLLVNGVLELNDPTANLYDLDEAGKLWSMIVINAEGERLYNNTQTTVHIEEYTMHSMIDEHKHRQKKVFKRTLDAKVVARFDFTNVTGVHTVTTAWVGPSGELFQVVEQNLFKAKGKKEPIKLWFWLDLTDSTHQYPAGVWTIQLFIDGRFVLADHFQLLKTSVYSPAGQLE